MFSRVLSRYLHVSVPVNGVNKEALMELRKKTGYAFSNCKKALESSDNDVKKAEKWLKEEAKKQGWAKAAQVNNRTAAQGLIAVHVDGQYAAMAEVNCETDFVARNADFQDFASQIIKASVKYAKKLPSLSTIVTKLSLGAKEMEKLRLKDGKHLNDVRALTVGRLGENIVLKRVLCIRVDAPQVRIAGYCHAVGGPSSHDYPTFGKYGSLVTYTENEGCQLDEEELKQLGQNLCQQVIGMNPTSVGLLEDFVKAMEDEAKAKEAKEEELKKEKAKEKKDETGEAATTPQAKEEEGTTEEEEGTTEEEEVSENRLLFQEYVANPDIKVGTVVADSQIDILDFVRFECGEPEPVE
uniref:Elongation factor Ts, mitochondrial n=1 Tax=Ornithodoros turicata TaxID=34597 RepID=A0A2R5LP51_9ACAR